MKPDKGNPVAPVPAGRLRLLIVLAAAVALAAMFAFTWQGTQGPAVRNGGLERLVVHDRPKPLPRIAAVDGSGKLRTLSEWKGKVLLVNFWATWCPPCRKEMPDIIALQEAYRDRDFRVIAISIDYQGYEKSWQFLRRFGGQGLILLWDADKSAFGAIGRPGLPVTLLVDRQGRERARLVGMAAWNSPAAHAIINRLLAEK